MHFVFITNSIIEQLHNSANLILVSQIIMFAYQNCHLASITLVCYLFPPNFPLTYINIDIVRETPRSSPEISSYVKCLDKGLFQIIELYLQ